jgi:hypothetical protein
VDEHTFVSVVTIIMAFIRIKNDRDVDQLLISRSHVLQICLEGTTELTEKGARKVATCIRSMDERPVVRIRVASHMSDFAFVFRVAQILYLEGNKPELYVYDVDDAKHPNSRMFYFNKSCLHLQRNRPELEEYVFESSLSKTASIQLGISLHGNTALKTLALWVDTNNFTIDHARALAAGICNSALTTLIIHKAGFNSTGFDEDVLRFLWQEGIQASGRMMKSLTLSASGQRLDTRELAEIVPCVESLTLRYAYVGLPTDASDFQFFCERLERTSNLLGLTLRQCRLDDDAMTKLVIGLRNHRSMKTLDLADNRIREAGITEFVENWPEDSKLELLNLAGNVITSDGLRPLMTALPNRRAMKTLNLMRNAFGCDGVEIIGNHLPNLNIREIMIGGVSMVDQAARTRAMNSCLRGIRANYFLQHLDIRGYSRDSLLQLEFKDEITLFTKLNQYGRSLLIADDVPLTLWCLIFAKARYEREFSLSIMFYFLVEQPHLVNERQGGKRRKRQTTAQPTKRRSARLRLSMD